ncbi:Card1-like endonuclease domain-containing protein [Breoghania sp.]|uniref:Card1-like endonuclease domain-containing protein n=1 Tax=Breoghania sp. TaxID=2065378 RepID=UPI002AA8199F|nr:DUF1887 family CARF protein [Breoghania sp.]
MSILKSLEFNGSGGSLTVAWNRAELTRLLYERFSLWAPFRSAIQQNREVPAPKESTLSEIFRMATASGQLTPAHSGHLPSGGEARRYFLGGWLEEFIAIALDEAGCHDVRFSQKVTWRAATDGSWHENELDAVARWRDRLVLVSCKAAANEALSRRSGEKRLFDALLELSYWNAHFGDGKALPILVTTADFYDETARRFRSPRLVERARVMDLAIIPADFGNWRSFQTHLTKLLETA